MMWTIAAPEIWNGQISEAVEEEEIICHHGIHLSVAREEAGQYRIRRVLSTDPNDFLCEGICPGTMIRR